MRTVPDSLDERDPPSPIAGRRGTKSVTTLMLLTTFFWASNIVGGKEALTGFTPLALAQLRMAGAAILYVVFYLAWRGLPNLRLAKRQVDSLVRTKASEWPARPIGLPNKT